MGRGGTFCAAQSDGDELEGGVGGEHGQIFVCGGWIIGDAVEMGEEGRDSAIDAEGGIDCVGGGRHG